MNRTRLWTLAIGALCALLLFVGVFAGLMPQLQSYQAKDRLADDTQVRVDAQRAQIERLEAEQARRAELERQHEELIAAIPETSNGEAQLRELVSISERTDVSIEQYTMSEAVPYESSEAAPEAAPSNAAGGEQGADEAEAAPQQADPQTTAPQPGNLVAIPFTLRVVGDYDDVVEFVRAAQVAERLTKLTNINITEAGAEGDSFSGELTGMLFVKPAT